MNEKLTVLIDGTPSIEYQRDKPLPERQQAYLERMDQRMNEGISLEGVEIANPDRMQRAKFVAQTLIQALQSADEKLAAAMCTYLAIRFHDLDKVEVTTNGDSVTVELVFQENTASPNVSRPH